MEVPCSPRGLTEPEACVERRAKLAAEQLFSVEYDSRKAEGDKLCRVT